MNAPGRTGRLLAVVLVLLLAFYASYRARQRAWVCDDSFISFRYAENLVLGHGLVFNPGERVEGYTNLSWTLLIALAILRGFDPVVSAKLLGILFYGLLAALLALRSYYRSEREGGAFLPLAACLVLAMEDFQVWATGGLETSCFAFLALAGVLLARKEDWRWLLFAGVVLGLVVATRPDGLLFAAVAGAWLLAAWWTRQGRWQAWTAFALPLAATGVALVAFKLSYYGELLPTAFYSKSAADPYYAQGILYVGLFFARNWGLVAAGLAILIALFRQRALRPPDATSELVLLAAAGGVYLVYVAHSGGDFMFARRLVPALPFLFLVAEAGLLRLRAPKLRGTIFAGALVLSLLPYPLYSGDERRISYIADEPHFYPPKSIANRKLQAEAVGRALLGSGARVIVEGGMASFAFYSKLPYVVEMTGLTQYSLARLPISRRGIPGHEKQATPEWLAENEIHLMIHQDYPYVGPQENGRRHDEVFFSNLVRARVLIYRDDIMDKLRKVPEVSFVPIEEALERFAEEIAKGPPETAEEILTYLDGYYLKHAGEKGREEARRLRALARTQSLPSSPAGTAEDSP